MLLVAAFALTLLPALPAQAQLNGSHSLGDFGVQSGSQPQPGFNAALFYYRFDTDTIKDADGNTVSLSPATPGSLALTAVAPIAWYVSKAKVLGGNYGVMVVLPFANASLEAPAFQLDRGIDTGIADMLVRPLDLGWHTKQADVAAGFQLYVPTGRYEPGASDNIGKGMWSYEPFVGTTVYLDEKRSLSLAATAYWEFHGKKEDSDVKVGQILSLQGGAGQVVPGRRADRRRGVLRAVEAHRRRAARVRVARRNAARHRRPQQASGLCLRAGRDPACGEQVEALRPGQHPLSVGNRRAGEDSGRHADHHDDLPGSEREAEVSLEG